ncbi:hypothetical protein BDV59DRAFT_181047 [Aspergillus ambiguus]|uniref:bZIP transcription factor n=1 Tax=Aspergillus ambiguus TaxID=176160 RepID=UPI003CCCFFB6
MRKAQLPPIRCENSFAVHKDLIVSGRCWAAHKAKFIHPPLFTIMDMPRKSPMTQRLAVDRAARKREQDRQAQRIAREKTKRLIAHLEARVETLTQFQSNGSVRTLIEELEKERRVNESLRATLQTIERVASANINQRSRHQKLQNRWFVC